MRGVNPNRPSWVPWSRQHVVDLLGEVCAEVLGVGDLSLVADFSGCVGPKTTRIYVQEWIACRGVSSFRMPNNQLWIVV